MHPSLITREGPLCQRCSDLDIPASFDSVEEKFEVEFAIDADSSPNCPLCILTRRVFLGLDFGRFDLYRGTRPRAEVFMEIEKSHSGQTKLSCMWITPSKYPSIESEKSKPLYDWPKDPRRVDFGPLKQKLAQCQTEHGPTCGAKVHVPVAGLRVYNCLTNQLEEATAHTTYVALSYVWGSGPERPSRKPPEQHRTICDAMQVALRFGYKYIWVDQLCIDQGGAHKLQQIQQMNRIYKNADLTIVAAAGDNSDFGIPGVQDRSRLGRQCFKIGDLQFLETLQQPFILRQQTTWSSRAWTFQEEVLSHRLLVFTERAAWFSCYLTPPEQGFEAKTRENDETEYQGIDDSALVRKTPRPPCGIVEPPHGFSSLFSDYPLRSLTYPSDVINAFSGILTELKEANSIISHVWGIPIIPPVASLDPTDYDEPQLVPLERNSVDGFIAGLRWVIDWKTETSKPRPGIPSWSWAGWQGYIEYRWLYEKENVDFRVEVFIERTDGQVLAWSEFEGQSYLENQPHLISRFIRLKAWTVDVKIEIHEPPDDPSSAVPYGGTWRYAVVRMLNGDELLSNAQILGEPASVSGEREKRDEFKSGSCTGVCLFPMDETPRSTRFVMLVRKVNENFQRVGYFVLGDFGYLRRTGPSGEITYNSKYCNQFDLDDLVLGLNARMEEVRIG